MDSQDGCSFRVGTGFCTASTFELTGRQRRDARPGLAKMYRVPPARAWWPAVGAPVERGVRPHLALHGDMSFFEVHSIERCDTELVTPEQLAAGVPELDEVCACAVDVDEAKMGEERFDG